MTVAGGALGWIETDRVSEFSNKSFGTSVSVTQNRMVVGGSGAAWKYVRDGGEWFPSSERLYPAARGQTTNVATDNDLTLVASWSSTTTYDGDVRTASLVGGRAVAVAGDAALIATEAEVYAIFFTDGAWRVRDIIIRLAFPSVAVSNMVIVGGEGEVHSYLRFVDRWIERDIVYHDAEGFGLAVALHGPYMVVGATEAAFLYKKRFEGASIGWSLVRELSSPIRGDAFGASVAVYGDVVVVGAPGRPDLAGAVYVFDTASDYEKLAASNARPGDNFGVAVCVDSRTVLVGATGLDAVYTYESDEDTSSSKKTTSPSTSWHAIVGAALVLGLVAGLAVVAAARYVRRRRQKFKPTSPTMADVRHASDDFDVPVATIEVESQPPTPTSRQTLAVTEVTEVPSPTKLFLNATVAVACTFSFEPPPLVVASPSGEDLGSEEDEGEHPV
ncbi:hypothetical protein CTAYLR_004610 [Chrysophaeum taylorii]|uniref:Uncharacterized protein n=1 Tax=Chrysophaeum taylorii TaxID=2483200 RepID=A0AAD7UEC0_9STRA|nr:hypothetical protein CTAYLR_004610 [Chrysophaeum taylorii]